MKRILWMVSAIILSIGLALFFSRNTVALLREQRKNTAQSEQRMLQAEAERAKLLKEKARLKTPSGIEELARKMGYQKEGERDLITNR